RPGDGGTRPSERALRALRRPDGGVAARAPERSCAGSTGGAPRPPRKRPRRGGRAPGPKPLGGPRRRPAPGGPRGPPPPGPAPPHAARGGGGGARSSPPPRHSMTVADADLRRLRELLEASRRPIVLLGPAMARAARRAAVERLTGPTGIPALPMESPRGVND